MRKLTESREGIYIEKKSKFICHLYSVKNVDEITEILKSEKKKYYDARHHCFAYILGDDASDIKCSDDGEPSGTAGRPMLDVLQKEGVTDILCVVIRYFGGTLLGTGGLVRAYQNALKDAIEKSSFKNESEAVIVKYKYAYNFDAKISSFLRDKNIKVLANDYSDMVEITIVLEKDIYSSIDLRLTDITGGSIEKIDETLCMYALD
ncbi:MAG: YigZ family protein [Lachnospiraceae bacterium]|nr:YigZ family protein [Lachnospiraceae bacterium]